MSHGLKNNNKGQKVILSLAKVGMSECMMHVWEVAR